MQQATPDQEEETNSDSACPDVRASPEKQTTEPQLSVELTEQPVTDNQCLVDTPTATDKDNKTAMTSSTSRLMERIKTSGDAKLLSLTPRLGVHHGDMVSLDDDEDAERASEAESGTNLLLQRLMKHIRVEKTPKAKDVEIRTVVKEGNEDSATLKTDVFVYSCDPVIDADSVSKLSKPGNCRLCMLNRDCLPCVVTIKKYYNSISFINPR
jgi:hypothetical protein